MVSVLYPGGVRGYVLVKLDFRELPLCAGRSNVVKHIGVSTQRKTQGGWCVIPDTSTRRSIPLEMNWPHSLSNHQNSTHFMSSPFTVEPADGMILPKETSTPAPSVSKEGA